MAVTKRLVILVVGLFVAVLCSCGGAAGPKTIAGGGGTPPPPAPTPPPPPPAPVLIKNVIVVVMQNGSFDHYFGKFPGVNGISPGTPGFTQTDAAGRTVTPALLTNTAPPDLPHSRQNFLDDWNKGAMDGFAKRGGALALGFYDNTTPGVDRLWALASQFALNDNFFASVMGDAPTNQLMMVAASDNDTPFSLEPVFGPCNADLKVPSAYTFQNVGDQLTAKNTTWSWFAEDLNNCGSYVSQENPFQYFTSTHASGNVRDFTSFNTALAAGTLPSVSFIQPSAAHSTHPGSGSVPDGLVWLDNFVHQVQASSIWNNAAIIVVWDSGGGWWDHVPPTQVDTQGLGFRVPLLVISPAAKKGFVSHVMTDDVSILRFIQTTFGLAPLNPRNQTSADLSDMFTP
ncbi:MAG: phospholipase C [Candidatus Sulfotelmatobacter sp.]